MMKDNADYIKTKIIDFYIKKYDDKIIIGNEVMYGSLKKNVDLLIVLNQKTIAIEIKSSNDDLRRLPDQIEQYKKTFDYIVIITTQHHIPQILPILPYDIGITKFENDNFHDIHKPLKQKELSKKEILNSIPLSFLYKKYSIIKENKDNIRCSLEKESLNKIHSLYISFLKERIQPKYDLFIKNRGQATIIDDISLLSAPLLIQ